METTDPGVASAKPEGRRFPLFSGNPLSQKRKGEHERNPGPAPGGFTGTGVPEAPGALTCWPPVPRAQACAPDGGPGQTLRSPWARNGDPAAAQPRRSRGSAGPGQGSGLRLPIHRGVSITSRQHIFSRSSFLDRKPKERNGAATFNSWQDNCETQPRRKRNVSQQRCTQGAGCLS